MIAAGGALNYMGSWIQEETERVFGRDTLGGLRLQCHGVESGERQMFGLPDPLLAFQIHLMGDCHRSDSSLPRPQSMNPGHDNEVFPNHQTGNN